MSFLSRVHTFRTYCGLWIAIAMGLTATSGPSQEPAERVQATITFTLSPPARPEEVSLHSPFGVNTALRPGLADLERRLALMQSAGIKWGRQDFTWRRIERQPGQYVWDDYDALVRQCRRYGLLLCGNLAYGPDFHDPRTEEGAAAYARFAREAAARYAGQVDHWQIWNEPNGGFWNGTADQYARLLAAAGRAIHEANPQAKVLAVNAAFCDVRFAETVLKQVPSDCYDIVCFHPYRPPSAPEDKFDWWMLDQYVKSWNRGKLDENYPLVHMTYLEQVATMKETLAKLGIEKPFWVTEICFNSHIHPYGTSELRQADLLVRFHVLSIASGMVEKVFWWTLMDQGTRQFDQADMVGIVRADYQPKYAFQAYGVMTRMLEGTRWIRNDVFGPDVFVCVFRDETRQQDILVAWCNKPYAYVRVTNTQDGLVFYDVFGTRRQVPYDRVRTSHLPVPLGESPIYIVGAVGTRATLRPDPGW
jgi:hypothetical protein